MRDYNAGNKLGAARALEYAAGQGHALALWKLGRMYADGDGVPHDDLKAFEYFSKIADENAEESPHSPNASVVASAFVALGTYFLDGIKGTYVKPDAARAHEMFRYRGLVLRRLRTRSTIWRDCTSRGRASSPTPDRRRAGSISPPRRAIIRRRRCSATCS